MRYLLESDGLSDLYDPEATGHEAIARRLASLSDSDQVFLSVLALYEQEYGFANAPDEKKPVIRRRISDAQEDFPILPLTAEAARLFGRLKASLRKARQLSDKGSKIHNIDHDCRHGALGGVRPGESRLHLSGCPEVLPRAEARELVVVRVAGVRRRPLLSLSEALLLQQPDG